MCIELWKIAYSHRQWKMLCQLISNADAINDNALYGIQRGAQKLEPHMLFPVNYYDEHVGHKHSNWILIGNPLSKLFIRHEPSSVNSNVYIRFNRD